MFALAIGAIVAGVGLVVSAGVALYNFAQANKPSNRVSAQTPTPSNDKDKKDREDKTLIGLKTPTINPPTLNAVPASVTVDFDSTTYHDKCILKLTNSSGSGVSVNDFSIRGMPVYRHAGNNGYRFEHVNHADVEANGENAYKVSSNYITSSAQCEDVGDYVRKELEPHDMYQVTLHGVHPYFQIGDRYELNVDYQLASMPFPTELVSVDVEIRGVQTARGCGDIGQTILSCRVPSGEWNKTTSTKAKWISSGLPLDKLNRSNELTIGAYDYAGQADVYCDGVNDDVQIKGAIDSLTEIGGGKIKLTRGSFIIGDTVILEDNIDISGEGAGTVISNSNQSSVAWFEGTGIKNVSISRIVFDGENINAPTPGVIRFVTAGINCLITEVEIKNLTFTSGFGTEVIGIIGQGAIVSNCYIHDFLCSVILAETAGIYGSTTNTNNIIENIISTEISTSAYGMTQCKKCQQNKVSGCTTANYNLCYADSGTAYPVDDTPDGGFNS